MAILNLIQFIFLALLTPKVILLTDNYWLINDFLQKVDGRKCYIFEYFQKNSHNDQREIVTLNPSKGFSFLHIEIMDQDQIDLQFPSLQTIFVIDLTGDINNNNDSFALKRYNINNGKWLVFLNKSDPDIRDITYLRHVLKTLEIPIISDFTIALKNVNQNGIFKLYSAYKIALKQTLMVKYLGFWNNSFYLTDQKSFYSDRKNFQRDTLRTLKIDTNLEQEFSKSAPMLVFHQSLYSLLKKVHNFKEEFVETDISYYSNRNDIHNSIKDLLESDELDLSNVAGLLNVQNVDQVDFLIPFIKFRPCFVFQNPDVSASYTSKIVKSFSSNTWYVIFALTILLCFLIKFAYWLEMKLHQISTKYSTAATLIITLSIIAQQGSSLYPENIGGRIIFLSLLLFGLLTYNYFTSSLVTLLLVSTPLTIDTIPQLQETSLHFGLENQSYTISIISLSTDPLVIEFSKKKLSFFDNERQFYSVDEAIGKIKSGGFAFHTDPTLLYPDLKKFDQNIVCNLKELPLVSESYVSLMVQKHSSYKELFTISLRRMDELGIIQKELELHIPSPPECFQQNIVISAGYQEIIIGVSILTVGIVLSLLQLLMEILWFRYKSEKKFVNIISN